jgi:hypothetical protein
MISIVTYGRNDNYGFNLAKRTAMSFNSLAEILTEEDEIFFVDYNTPGHLPTLPEDIWDTFTEKARQIIKVIRISSQVHQEIKKDSPLPILENVSRNAAIVRSNPKNHWMLSTNPDVLLVLASKWKTFPELLSSLRDSFYELPRFDIPESVWGSLSRFDPKSNMSVLRDWLIANRAAVAETVADYRFQKYYLFDAPGDFQLAPREYFFLCRGFDEAMNLHFHSDSNLAKRMWLLNGQKTDHIVEDLWVLHQDHYLSGEWTSRTSSTKPNNWMKKVILQDEIEANDSNWGLQNIDLPVFNLAERMGKRRTFSLGQPVAECNGNLTLSREIDWSMQPVYRLHHYDPEQITLYLREMLQVIPLQSNVIYVGDNAQTLALIRKTWSEISPGGPEILDLLTVTSASEDILPDVLLVDCFYERSEAWERSVRAASNRIQEQLSRKRISEAEAHEEIARYADTADHVNLEKRLIPLWHRQFKKIRLRTGAYVIVLGCNTYVDLFARFQEAIAIPCGLKQSPGLLVTLHSAFQKLKQKLGSLDDEGIEVPRKDLGVVLKTILGIRFAKRKFCRKWIGHNSLMGMIYYYNVRRRIKGLIRRLNLQQLYIHHRLIVMRIKSRDFS